MKMTSPIDLFFGHKKQKVINLCHSIHLQEKCIEKLKSILKRCQSSRKRLYDQEADNLKKLEVRLSEVEESMRRIGHKRRPHQLKFDEADFRVNTFKGKLLTLFESIISFNFDHSNQTKTKLKEAKDALKEVNAIFDEQKEAEEALKEALKDLNFPLIDLDFAINSLSREIEKFEDKAEKLDEQLNEAIKETVTNLNISLWFYNANAVNRAFDEKSLKLILRTKSLLHQHQSLKVLPQVESSSFLSLDADYIVNTLEKTLFTKNIDAQCRLPMTGSGRAHKKVRRTRTVNGRTSSSTSWKRINVNFSGTIHPVVHFEQKRWKADKFSQHLANETAADFSTSFKKEREKVLNKELQKLEQEIENNVKLLRVTLGLNK